MSAEEFSPEQLTDADLHEVTALDDQNLLGFLEANEEERLEKGEIVSPDLLSDLTEEFEEQFGNTDARLSYLDPGEDGLTLLCLRPWNGDGTEAVVMATKVEA